MKKVCLVLLACLFPVLALAAQEPIVYVYNWTEYLPDEVIEAFQQETGIKVNYATYDSNEAMYAKIKLLNGGGYDVAFPSTYYVQKMIKDGLLSPIDRSKLPNFKHLDPLLLDKAYDPGNTYSVPYVYGSTGIGYNSNDVKKEDVASWKDLWKPEFKNRLVLNDDIREVFGIGLIISGYSVNDTDPEHIRIAYEALKELLPNVRVFASDSPKQPFLNQEVVAGMIWNGEIYMAADENPAIQYLYPSEGAMFWIDSMVIPKNAENKESAHAFINYILRPEVAKQICEYVGYALANKSALSLFDDAMRANKTVFPDEKDIAAGEFQTDVGDAILIYEKYWEKLKTGN